MNRRLAACAGLALALAGCGSAGYSYAGPGPPAVLSAQPGSLAHPPTVALHVGQVLSVPVIGLEEASATPPGILAQVNGGSAVVDFRAVKAGRATVNVTRAASCSPGQACSKLVVVASRLDVVVTG